MFALGITPLITAQIVVQLLGSVIPSLGKLQKKGEHGQKVTKKITNVVGIVLAIVQSCCMAIGFNQRRLNQRKRRFMCYLNHNIYDSRNRYHDVACAYP